jgi:drug/metabolite transporter (DMT)-like permease
MAFVLALLSAAMYGAADFLGGIAARRGAVAAVVLVGQGTGFLLLAVIVPVLPGAVPLAIDMYWGAAAGVAGGVGVALLYRALAIGTMGIVAPVTAVCAVIIPVAAGLLRGDRLHTTVAVGIAVALLSIVLVGQSPAMEEAAVDGGARTAPGGEVPAPVGDRVARVPDGLGIALLSGAAIGLFYLCLAETRTEAGMWPLLAARAASTAFFVAMFLAVRSGRHLPGPAVRLALAAGIVDVAANALYLLAARRGALSIVVTLVSLYPASTVLLARLVLNERFSQVQIAGIALALGAVLLIVGGS